MNASVASPRDAMGKVPQVTLLFWLIKIAATTLGETGGDAVSMSWLGETTPGATGYGYLVGTAIFAAIFALAVWAQIRATRFHPFLYWTTIIASTTVGTTLADYVTRSLGIGYAGGSTLLLALVLGSLWWWKHALGTVSVDSVADPTSEVFYWLTIMCSQTLGTALGDWVADTGAWATPAACWCSAACSHSSPPCTAGRRSRIPCCSGRPSSSPVRWARCSAISSTSRWRKVGWN